jgi:hypothetical protein
MGRNSAEHISRDYPVQMSSSLHAYAHKVCEQMYTSFEADGVEHGRALLDADALLNSTLPISVDVSFIFNCAYMVFFMQFGFAAVRNRAQHFTTPELCPDPLDPLSVCMLFAQVT